MEETGEIEQEIQIRFRGRTHGLQYDFGTSKSNILCVLCQNRGKLHFSKNIQEHASHCLKEHSEELGLRKPTA